MDERKRSSQLKVRVFYGLCVLSLTFVGYSAYIYLSLPSISNINKCFTTSMFKVKLCPKGQNYVRYSQIPKDLRKALILSEDASFYSHQGLDWYEIKESFKRNWKEGRIARGGSTITQQLAKNMYLSQRKTPGRKIQEFFLARRIEKKLKKSQIIEKYFNIVEFGFKIYGIKKAASHYFRKSPSQLNLLESVYLISLLPNPKKLGNSWDKKRLSESNIWRMKTILRRLYRTNHITEMLYRYCLELIEQQTWPFPIFNEYDANRYNIEEELGTELEQMEEEYLQSDLDSVDDADSADDSSSDDDYSDDTSSDADPLPNQDDESSAVEKETPVGSESEDGDTNPGIEEKTDSFEKEVSEEPSTEDEI